ncbi:MAG: ABC transporter permease [Rhodobacteraceae bacterium]|nr:ABC transporter permease [Paracoccaceae bacterium]
MSSLGPINPAGWALATRFAFRELRGGLRGFYIFIACIALGVCAISGVSSVSRALTEGIVAEGQSILGGDIAFTLRHQQLTDEQRDWITTLGQTSEILTMRAIARTDDGNDQTLVEVKAIDDAYPLVGSLELQTSGDLKSHLRNTGDMAGAVVDQTLLSRLNLQLGDTIQLGRGRFEITGVIAREPDKLASGLELGPRVMVEKAALAPTGLVQPGSLIQYHTRVRLGANPSEAELEAVIEAAKAEFPDAGWRIRSRANAAPGLKRNIDRFAQFLTLVGLTALVIGGVGVANAVRAYLDTKRDVIASFKSLGATGAFAFKIYLVQMLVIAAIGIVIGLIGGAIIPFLAGAALQGVLPIELQTNVFPSELALSALYGVLTALTFAVWPLGRAHDIPATALFRDLVNTGKDLPRKRYIVATVVLVSTLVVLAVSLSFDKRIALIYIGSSAAAFALLTIVSRLIMSLARRSPAVRSTELRMAIANIHRPGALTPSVVLSLGLGLSLLVALALIDGNLRNELNSTIADKAPSFFFIDVQSGEKDALITQIKADAPDAKIESVPMLRGRITALKGIPTATYQKSGYSSWVLRGDRGITYEASKPENSKLERGTWWASDYEGDPLVSIEDETARELDLEVGDTLTVNVLGREITATIANTRNVEWETLAINFILVFSPNTFAGAPHANLMTLGWDENVPVEKELGVLKRVSTAFPTITSIRVKEAIDQVNNLVAQLAWAIRGASSITLISSILVLAGALAAGHRHRIYDAVILKSLGATRRRLIQTYALEYALLGLTTALFSLVAGGLASWFVVTQVMGGNFTFLPVTAIAAALIALVLTVGFGLLGTWRVLGEKPAPVLRNL